MEPFQQRVIDEKTELDARIKKLAVFLNSPMCFTLEPDDLVLIRQQYGLMVEYSNLLLKRMSRFKLSELLSEG